MTVDIKKNSGTTVISVAGRLDTITAPALDKAIAENFEGTAELVLDLKELQYISSAGLRVLLSAQKKMHGVGSMKLVGVCESVMEVLEMTGFSEILVIE